IPSRVEGVQGRNTFLVRSSARMAAQDRQPQCAAELGYCTITGQSVSPGNHLRGLQLSRIVAGGPLVRPQQGSTTSVVGEYRRRPSRRTRRSRDSEKVLLAEV